MADYSTMRVLVRTAYTLQKIRIEIGNRIVMNFRYKLGIKSSEKPTEGQVTNILAKLKKEYAQITDGIIDKKTIPREKEFEPVGGYITDYAELLIVNQYMQLRKEEARSFDDIKGQLEHFPIWTEFLTHISGIGPAIAGLILSEIDIRKAKYASSLHKYCGLDVVIMEDEDGNLYGEARGRKKAHLVEQTYLDSEGNEQTKMGISYKPILKTKLLGVLAPNFIKSAATRKNSDKPAKENKYEKLYRQYKHRITNDPRHKDKSKMHINRMALRYCVKIFIIDLYVEWRRQEGLEVHPPYHEAKLGLYHDKVAAEGTGFKTPKILLSDKNPTEKKTKEKREKTNQTRQSSFGRQNISKY